MAKLVQVSPDSPERCQGRSEAYGQCPFKAEPSSKYCLRHGGFKGLEDQVKKQDRLYKLAKWQAQIAEHADHPNIKSLREEIAVLRITLQERLNSCQSNWDLLANAGTISELVMKIGVLVKQCHNIEKDLGRLLDKAQAVKLATEMVGVISMYIDNPDILNAIAEDLSRKVTDILNAAHAA